MMFWVWLLTLVSADPREAPRNSWNLIQFVESRETPTQPRIGHDPKNVEEAMYKPVKMDVYLNLDILF